MPRYCAGAFSLSFASGREDVDLRQVVPQPHLVVIEVVRRRDFHAAGTEGRVDVTVGNHRDGAAGERQLQLPCQPMPW
jgi:hypothetical protein